MTDMLQHLLREEGERLDVPPPPVDAILAGGRSRRRSHRTRRVVALAAAVVVVAGGLVGVSRLVAEDGRGLSPAPADTPSSGPSTPVTGGPLDVSGSGVGTLPFGVDADEVVAAVSAQLGEPDLTEGPQRYVRIPGSESWFEDGNDPLSLSWQHPITSVTCWGGLCLVFGGDEADTLTLRGWELAQHRRWSSSEEAEELQLPDVRLARTGIRLGDSWEKLHAAYPKTVVGGAEGASVSVRNTPWTGIFDGVAGWRLSGQWDYAHPTRAPEGAVVTRLSGGEGPEPGCC